jgi:methylated-DNA-protein-cysteine methyltransferase-like protein
VGGAQVSAEPEATAFQSAVAKVLSDLRPGEVVTYGEVAAEAGYPGAARAVGTFLRDHEGFPWWRVLRSDGRLLAGHVQEQTRRLTAEGVPVTDGRVRRGPVGRRPGRGRPAPPARAG